MSHETTTPGYLHGTSEGEQDRLYQQARFLESRIYDTVDFSKQTNLLEVGSGVGAQTEILLRRFPQAKIQSIDISQAQTERAKQHLAPQIKEGRVNIALGNAETLPFASDSFDGAFICWLLEHVQNPVQILKEVKRVIKSEAIVYCTEVMNATFFVNPYSPATLQYWFAFNDHQCNLGGDPFVGAKLGNYLKEAGFQNIETRVKSFHFDNRMPKIRSQMFEYWKQLLLSGTPSMLEAGKVTVELVSEMKRELETLKADPDAIFFYSCMQAKGQVF